MSSELFRPETHLLEIVVRVALIYVFLLVLVRLCGKREVGKLSPMEFLSTLLLSETVSPALTGEDKSFTAAVVASTTLLVLTVVASLITFRWRPAERLIEGDADTLMRDGVVDAAVMRRHRITRQELHAALHREGVDSEDEVKRAYVESSGDITVVSRSG